MFISPMGEPLRAAQHPGAAEALWFSGADGNGDGHITEAEFQHDAARFFAALDRGKDGEIDPDDIAYYETALVPEIRVASSARDHGASGTIPDRGRSRDGDGQGGRGRGGNGEGGRAIGRGDGRSSASAAHVRVGAA